MRHYNEKLVTRAKELRAEPTSAEEILWQNLRHKQVNGRKFRRQQPIGPFIVDFYCAEVKLAIELDGDVHAAREAADRSRQQFLESQGLTVLRFCNSDVWGNLKGVLETIYSACAGAME